MERSSTTLDAHRPEIREPETPGREILSGTMTLGLTQAVTLVLGFVIAATLTRWLEPEGYGLYGIAVTIVLWIELSISTLLFPAVKHIASANNTVPIAAAMLRLFLWVGGLSGLLLALGAGALSSLFSEPELSPLLLLLAIDIPLFAWSQAHIGVLLGLGRYGHRTLIGVVRWGVRAVLVVGLVGLGFSVHGAIVGLVLSSAVEAVVCHLMIPIPFARGPKLPMSGIWASAGVLAIAAMVIRIFLGLDVFMLKFLGASAAAAGLYLAAQTLSTSPIVLISGSVQAILPALSRSLRNDDVDAARNATRTTLRIPFWLVPGSAAVAGSAAAVMRLFFGQPYGEGGPVLAWLVFASPATLALLLANSAVAASGAPKLVLRNMLVALVTAISALFILIPAHGATGAAIATTLACTVAMVTCFLSVHTTLSALPPAGTVIRSTVVAAVVGVVSCQWATEGIFVLFELCSLSIAAVIGFVALGEVSADDRAALRSVASASMAQWRHTAGRIQAAVRGWGEHHHKGLRCIPTILAILAVSIVVAVVGAPRGDFFNYLAAAHAWLSGVGSDALAQLPDFRWFADQAARAGLGDKLVGFAVLTPPSALLGVPLAVLPPEIALRVWQIAQGVLLLICGLGISRSCNRPFWWGMLPFALLLPAVGSHLYQGQFHLLAVAALAWGMVWWRGGQPVPAGVAWAFAVGLKVHAWPVLAVLAVTRQRTALTAAAVTLAGGAVFSIALLGWPLHSIWLSEGVPTGAAGLFLDPWHTSFQSLGHGLRRLLVDHPVFNPTASWHAPGLAGGMAAAVHGLVVGWTIATAFTGDTTADSKRAEQRQTLVFSAAAMAALISGPILSTYHLVFLAPPVAWAVDALWRGGRRGHAAAIALTTIAIAAVPSLPDAAALLSVPRAWLALVLWLLVVPRPRIPLVHSTMAAIAVAAAFGAGGAWRTSEWFADRDGAVRFDHPSAPFSAAELEKSADGVLYFSGFSLDRQGHPGRGWMGWSWDPDDPAGPRVVAADPHLHVWAPIFEASGHIAWTRGPATPLAPGCSLPDGRVIEVRTRGGQSDLVVLDGNDAIWITSHPGHDTDPVIDVQRRRIWFLSDRGAGSRALRLWWVPIPESSERSRSGQPEIN